MDTIGRSTVPPRSFNTLVKFVSAPSSASPIASTPSTCGPVSDQLVGMLWKRWRQLSLGMAYYRKGDYATAIVEGHKAEKLKPNEQLAHTNLSLFYMKSGDKKTAEHHGLQARIASWKGNMTAPGARAAGDPELEMAKPQAPVVKVGEKFPDMPWKKKPKVRHDGDAGTGGGDSGKDTKP